MFLVDLFFLVRRDILVVLVMLESLHAVVLLRFLWFRVSFLAHSKPTTAFEVLLLDLFVGLKISLLLGVCLWDLN